MESTPESQPKPELLKERPTEFNRVTVGELEQQCHDLRTLLNATFVALLVLSLSVNLFLGKQMRLVRAKVSESRPVIQRMQAEFQKKEPNMRNFVNALQSFGAVHADFLPILQTLGYVVTGIVALPIVIGNPIMMIGAFYAYKQYKAYNAQQDAELLKNYREKHAQKTKHD